MPESYQQYERHFVDLSKPNTPREYSLLRVAEFCIVCTEDRGIEGIQFANQLPGGAHGLEADADVARAITMEGNHEATWGETIENARRFAEITGATNHLGCAAIANHLIIMKYQADPDNADKLYRDSDNLVPGALSERQLEIGQEYLGRKYVAAIDAGFNLEQMLEEMGVEGEDGMGIPMLPLHHNAAHAGKVMIGNSVGGSYYDTAAAFPDDAAYGLTAHALPKIALDINERPDSLVAAAVFRASAVAAHLPNPNSPSGVGVELAHRERSLHEVA